MRKITNKCIYQSLVSNDLDRSTACHIYTDKSHINEDEWIYFDELIKKVPIAEYNKRKFIIKKKKLFFEENNLLYFINIFDYKLKDAISPLSFEKEKIKSIILNIRMNELRKKLRMDLYEDALKNNSLENYVND